jgi:predicted DNA binding CopG/RHH family protein
MGRPIIWDAANEKHIVTEHPDRLGQLRGRSLSRPRSPRQRQCAQEVDEEMAGTKMRYPDPYEGMTDEEFEEDFYQAVHKERLKAVSLRLPESVIARSKEVARQRGIPYQTLIKGLIEAGLMRLGSGGQGDLTGHGI